MRSPFFTAWLSTSRPSGPSTSAIVACARACGAPPLSISAAMRAPSLSRQRRPTLEGHRDRHERQREEREREERHRAAPRIERRLDERRGVAEPDEEPGEEPPHEPVPGEEHARSEEPRGDEAAPEQRAAP